MKFIIKLVITGLSLLIADWLLPGIELNSALAILLGALILGIINAIVKPILVVLTLPITVLTLGLFLLVVNALTYWLTSALVPGFEVSGFAAAFLGAIITSVVSWLLNRFVD